MSSQRSSSKCLRSGESESIAQPSKAVPTTTSSATTKMALPAVRPTRGSSGEQPLSKVITPVRFAIASTPLNARITLTNAVQFFPKLCCDGCRYCTVRCGRLAIEIKITMITVGMAKETAMLPLCFGPNQLIAPTTKIRPTVAATRCSFGT